MSVYFDSPLTKRESITEFRTSFTSREMIVNILSLTFVSSLLASYSDTKQAQKTRIRGQPLAIVVVLEKYQEQLKNSRIIKDHLLPLPPYKSEQVLGFRLTVNWTRLWAVKNLPGTDRISPGHHRHIKLSEKS